VKLLSNGTLQAIQAENIKSQTKHGEKAMMNPNLTKGERLAIMGEEFGEVCTALTYDHRKNGKDSLVTELLQLAAMAAVWAQLEDENGQQIPSL
jgi:hypothetical protein